MDIHDTQGRSKGRAAGAAALSTKFRGANLMINIAFCLILSVKIAPFIKETHKKEQKKIPLRGSGRIFPLRP